MRTLDLLALGNLFRSIGDPVRLRMLHLMAASELSVGELVRILNLPQSSVSRHLKGLKEQGLVADRPVGAATFYRPSLEADLGNASEAALRDALTALLRPEALAPADRERLDRTLALRGEDGGGAFFDRIGLRWDALREECFGPTFHLEALIRLLPADWAVADLGTGTGYLLPVLGQHFRRVIGIDMSQAMLELAARRVKEVGARNVDLRAGTLEELPLADGEADLCVAVLMLHHLNDVPRALAEIARGLKRGGRLLLIEIHPHANEAFRVAMADRRPGIDAGALRGWLAEAGFGELEFWDLPHAERPEHALTPLPRLYGCVAVCGSARVSRAADGEDFSVHGAHQSQSPAAAAPAPVTVGGSASVWKPDLPSNGSAARETRALPSPSSAVGETPSPHGGTDKFDHESLITKGRL